jgi:hypothetical protein
LNHFATPEFWQHYRGLPQAIQLLADECFERMKSNPRYPSIHLKRVGEYWSARVGLHYRAVAVEENAELVWFWIGPHDEYDKLINS